MKQKNLILVAVAVGCGLVAAFLTSQIGAKTSTVDQVEIPVAAKDLPVGTKLSKEEIDQLVVFKKFTKDALPPAYASTKEEMADKRLVRTIRQGEAFNPADLTINAPISPPPGYNMVSFSSTPEKSVAGFAGPGSKVDMLCTIKSQKQHNKTITFPLLLDMLVLAVDANTQYAKEGAFHNLSSVSLAVTSKQATLLHQAISRGADLRLVLRNADKPADWGKVYSEEEIMAILADEDDHTDGGRAGGKEMVKLPVPTEDLGAGTQLTPEVLSSKFKLIEVAPPAPPQFVFDLKEHAGRYLLKDLAADQFVPRSALGEKQQPKAEPQLGSIEKSAPSDPTKPVDPVVPVKERVFWDATVQTSTGVKKYRYEKLENNEYRYLGEVKEDGSVKPTKPLPNHVTPEKAPESKPESNGRAI
jgi:Flp pilus assembly protein CpaB